MGDNRMETEWWNKFAAVLEAWEIAVEAEDEASEARREAFRNVGITFTDFARTYPTAHNGTPESIYEMLESNGIARNDTETARRYAKMVRLVTD